MDNIKCAVTGQVTWPGLSIYKENNPDYVMLKNLLKQAMTDLVEKEGVREYVVGLTSIMQLCAAEITLELKQKYSDLMLKYVEAYGSQGYAYYKSTVLVNRYLNIMNKCDGHITLQKGYTEGSEDRQYAYIAEYSNMVLGIWRHIAVRKNSIVSAALNRGKPTYCIQQSTGEIIFMRKEETRITKIKGIVIGESRYT